jgi:hypothetical protein
LIEVRANSADQLLEQRDLPGVIQAAMNRAVQHEIVSILFPERMRLLGQGADLQPRRIKTGDAPAIVR